MDSRNSELSALEVQGTHASREELVARLVRAMRDDGTVEPVPGLHLHRVSSSTGLGHGVSSPSFCVIAQGSKEVLLGANRYHYDPAHYLIATAALPVAIRIVEASPERPYLGLALKLDPSLVGSVIIETGQLALASQSAVTAVDVSPLEVDLLEAVVRLVRLVDAPTHARFLAPLVTREIIYRLLMGAQARRLGQIAAFGGPTQRIGTAVERLRNNFDQPLYVEEIARELGMSVSGFHHHFRAVTAMSPIQFQKQLRLQQARRLMLGEGLDAASAAYRVGYGNVSHFTREYKRLFGATPKNDVEHLRDGAGERVVG